MFCTAKELGLCPERSLKRKLTRSHGCVLISLQRTDWKEGNPKARTPTERLIHKFRGGRKWV